MRCSILRAEACQRCGRREQGLIVGEEYED